MKHALVKLARLVDWGFLEERFGAVYTDGPGSPPLPTRLMAGLEILKYTYNLSDERVCEHWTQNPYFQYFCGEEFFQHNLTFDRSSLTRWRQRMMPPTQSSPPPDITSAPCSDGSVFSCASSWRGFVARHSQALRDDGEVHGRLFI